MKLTIQTPGGPLSFRFDRSSSVQADMERDLLGDGYEPATWQWLCEHIKPGDRVVDVGAHVGVFTCLMARLVGPTGHVDAFEPHPQNRTQLLRHLRDNDLSWVTVHKTACADTTGMIHFHHNADNDGGHAIYDPGRMPANPKSRASPKSQLVKSVRLEDVVQGPVSCLKIDVEGAEFSVLKGAELTLRRDHPVIVAEINAPGLLAMGTDETFFRAWMRDLGYRESALVDIGEQPLAANETYSVISGEPGNQIVPIWNVAFI